MQKYTIFLGFKHYYQLVIHIGSLNISMTISNYVRLQNLMNNRLMRNDLWKMEICG